MKKKHRTKPYRLEDDPKYKRAKRELEALRTTGSTDSLIFSPLLRAAKPRTENSHEP